MDAELDALSIALGEALTARGWMLTTAESCTGGWIAEAVTATSGSSAWFDRGFVTYTNSAKVDMLGVSLVRVARRCDGLLDVAARAAAGVGPMRLGRVAGADQLGKGPLVSGPQLGLVDRRLVRYQSAGGQLQQNHLRGLGRAARGVHIFNAHQPAPTTFAVSRPCVQPTGERRHQRARVERAGG